MRMLNFPFDSESGVPADDLDALVVHLRYPTGHCRWVAKYDPAQRDHCRSRSALFTPKAEATSLTLVLVA